jgi:hypothetical protein
MLVLSLAALAPGTDFVDVFSADAAGDRSGLSVAVAGRVKEHSRDTTTVRVYTRGRSSGWHRTPALAEPLRAGSALSLTRTRGITCAGYDGRPRHRALACLRRGRWRDLPRAGLPAPPARLLKLFAVRGGLAAAFIASERVVVLRLSDRRWRRVGRSLPIGRSIPAIGESGPGQRIIDVSFVDVASGRRTVRSLVGRRWRSAPPLEAAGGGPAPGGPVRFGGRLYLPVMDATADPWELSAYSLAGGRWSVAAARLNAGAGSAQGVLRLGAGSVWAAWQENEPRDDGLFDTHMYVRPVAPAGRPATEVWSGASIGPGTIETVEGGGRTWVLYMPGAPGRRALTVALEPLR